ncbi:MULTISPECIES: hypothetical protein [Bacillus]|uniref:Uncharacterized protein n=2 Tax=Bacillus TaxID=1386 RepID=A0A0M3R9R7_9BACI|nr:MULTISPECIES: hypothetical protein [Bacillus]ALC81896.1 hypothetical protein AM592_09960 [Bacillus gobiensis]MBP1083208.1 ABC-type cobalt transport system substrate-binding protein [Bacillus capparidis]MED1097648.1 hypothetical protein [Bacillus capparidis]
MKILGIFILILFLCLSLIAGIDLLMGFDPSHILYHLFNPFWVIETGELVMLLFFLLLTVGQQIYFMIKNKANKQKGSS